MMTNTSILILNDNYDRNIPVITDSTGKVEYRGQDFHFHSGHGTEVYLSCSVKFRNEFYVFGGESKQKTQISKVTDCSLKKIGKLEFDFAYGACAVVNEESIYLCFNRFEKQCHVGSDPVKPFSKITQSQFYHDSTRIAASDGNHLNFNLFYICFLAFILAVGSGSSGSQHKLVEKYEFGTMSWVSLGEYPFDMVQTILTFSKKQN